MNANHFTIYVCVCCAVCLVHEKRKQQQYPLTNRAETIVEGGANKFPVESISYQFFSCVICFVLCYARSSADERSLVNNKVK